MDGRTDERTDGQIDEKNRLINQWTDRIDRYGRLGARMDEQKDQQTVQWIEPMHGWMDALDEWMDQETVKSWIRR